MGNLYEVSTNGTITTSGNIETSGSFIGERTPSSGEIVQMQVLNDTGNYSQTSDTPAEITTNWRLAFTPKYSDSKILLKASFSANTSAGQVYAFKFYDVTNATDIGVGPAFGNRRQTGRAIRGPNLDGNDATIIDVEAITDANTTTARTYTLYGQRENTGSGTIYFNYSSGDSSAFGWSTPFTLTITEIKQ